MVELFDAAVSAAGRTLERAAARDGTRGIGITRATPGAARELVTIVGPGVPREVLAEHPGWDLPLVTVREIETSSGPRTFVAEALPAGIPSTWLDDASPATGVQALAPFAAELAQLVAAEHARGGVVGPLDPATVLVDPEHRSLVAVAQRPLRIADVVAGEGDRPLLGYRTWTPGDLSGSSTSADDVFRLAIILWWWRHGAHPFGALRDAALFGMLSAISDGERSPLPEPADDLDRTLVACLNGSAATRPTAADVVEALAARATP